MSRPAADSRSRRSLFNGLLRIASLVWWLVLVVLVLLALYAGVGRQLTQNIDHYRSNLEQRLSEELGQPVSIARLDANWRWLDPIVEASGLKLHHPERADAVVAELRHLRLRLDTLSSLMRFRLVFRDFEADSLDLTVSRTEDGQIAVDGLGLLASVDNGGSTAKEVASGAEVWIDRLGSWLSDPFVRITRINLGINVPGDPIQYVDIPQVDLTYDSGLFQASGRAMRSGTTEQIASFSLSGHHFFRGGFDGQLYLDVDSGRLFDGLLQGFGWRHLTVLGFDMKGQGWLAFEDGRLIFAKGKVNMPYLQLQTEQETLAPIENIAADIGWRRNGGGGDSQPADSRPANSSVGELHLRHLTWRWSSIEVPPFDLKVALTEGGLALTGDGIPVGPMQRLGIGLQLLPYQASRALAQYQPAGTLNDVILTVPSNAAAGNAFNFSARLEQVSVQAYDGAPGASGLSGHLVMNQLGGWVDVDAANVTLGFPELFLNNWQFDRLKATVGWLLDDETTRVFSDNIELDYQEATKLSGSFELRMDRRGEDTLGLQVRVKNGDAGMVADFVPARIVSGGLYGWLTEAITDVKVNDGVFYGQGLIGDDSPEGSFTSSMQFRFSDATVRYADDWPSVVDARGEVSIHNEQADIRLDQARTGDLTLSPTDVQVAENDKANVVVSVDTGARVPGAVVNDWLRMTPLGDMVGAAGQSVELGGDYDLKLALVLPLGSGQAPDVVANVSTTNGQLRYPAADLTWSDITGQLRYDSHEGFSGAPLAARFLGEPIEVQLALDDANGRLRIVQTGRLSASTVLHQAGLDPDVSANAGISGTIDYSAKLAVSADTASALEIASDLKGLAIDWPAPFAKSVGESVPLQASVDWRDESGFELAGDWHQRLAFRLKWQGSAFDRGRIALAARSTQLPNHSGLNIAGPISQLDAEHWQEAAGRLSTGDGGWQGLGNAATGVHTWLDSIDLNIGTLILAEQTFPQVTVRARPEAYGWILDTVSERLTGRVLVPLEASEAVQVNLTKLTLVSAESDASYGDDNGVAAQAEALEALQWERWPDVQVQIDALTMNQSDYGAWSFRLEPEPDALYVRSIEGHLKAMTFEGQLSWDVRNNVEATRLTGEMTGGSLADLSSIVDGDVPFRNEKSQMLVNLTWAGSPDEYTLQTLDGSISMRFDDGVILEQNNTAQLFRIFNLLNSDTLWRRLKLDFSDLYEAGVAFDAISGKAVLKQGTLTWDPELQIVGPSGAFKLSGTSNLMDESLDMRLVVVLPLTQNLPLAALLLGAGAPIGGALFVLDKVLGDPLSKLTSATYSVGGRWSDPEIELRSVFDTGK